MDNDCKSRSLLIKMFNDSVHTYIIATVYTVYTHTA